VGAATDADRAQERDELREIARRLLEKESSTRSVRAVSDGELGHDAALWQTMAQLGWTGLGIPEELGGSGSGFPEQAVVLGELGRAVTPGPYLSTVVLGAGVLLACDQTSRTADLLGSVARGELALSVVVPAGGDRTLAEARRTDTGLVLTGTAPFVLDAAAASLLLVVARDLDQPGRVLVVAVPASTPGVEHRVIPTIDRTRRLAAVSFAEAVVEPGGVLGRFDERTFLSWLTDRAAAALVADSVGGAQRVLEMSVEYAKVRVQFGRPIGTFQAIKHKCADMLLVVEASKAAAEEAAERVPALPGGEWRPVAVAKAYVCDAYAKVTADALQLHGGIGYTWEHDLHLFFKRSKLNQALFGDPSWYRARLADDLLTPTHGTAGSGGEP
jgi:alkylation response protein AidB-like acyl-CoA dehydrogenase